MRASVSVRVGAGMRPKRRHWERGLEGRLLSSSLHFLISGAVDSFSEKWKGCEAHCGTCCRCGEPAAAHIFGARCNRIQLLYLISGHWGIVISSLFYHKKHIKADGAIVVHHYIRYVAKNDIVYKWTRLYRQNSTNGGKEVACCPH